MELKEQPVKRHLTAREIQTILNRIPNVKAAVAKIAAYETSQVKEKLRNQLREIMIYPANIPSLSGIILNQFFRSLIPAGEAIGPSTSEGIGGPTTQMTLNTFHQAGSAADIASGLDKLRELLNMTKERKSKISYIHFKNKDLTQDEVIDLKREIVGVSISKLVSGQPSVRSTKKGNPDNTYSPISLNERGWWYQSYLEMVAHDQKSDDYLNATHYLRIKLSRDKLFAYNVTTEEVVTTIQSEQSGVINCVVSPYINKEIIVDVYIDQNSVDEPLKEHMAHKKTDTPIGGIRNPTFCAFMYVIIPKIMDDTSFIIKGIHNITNITPKGEKVMSIVRSIVPSKREDDVSPELQNKYHRKHMWFFWIDEIASRSNGIPISKLIKLIKACGIEIIEEPQIDTIDPYSILPRKWKQPDVRPKKIVVLMKNGENPETYMNDLISKANDEESERINKQMAGEKGYDDISDIVRHSNYFYAIGTGSNLRAMLRHPAVDGNQSITNDIGLSKNGNDIYTVIGIQASYSSIVLDFYRVINGSGSYCSPQHITTLASSMTNFVPTAITSRGVVRQNRGAFADASFEHAVEIFIKTATAGKLESVNATSASIFFGNRGKFGTGSFKLALNVDAIKKIENAVNEVNNDTTQVESILATLLAKSKAFNSNKSFIAKESFDFNSFTFIDNGNEIPEQTNVYNLSEIDVGDLPDPTNILTFDNVPQLSAMLTSILA